MEKRDLINCFVILLLFVSLITAVLAQQNPGDVSDVLGNQFNVSGDKIPTSQEDIERIRDEYLQKEWTNMISNTSVIGPIHNFFSNDKTQIFFQVIFAHKYELSLTFFFIVVLWIFFLIHATKLIRMINLSKLPIEFGGTSLTESSLLSFFMSLLVTIILAQARLFLMISSFVNDFFFKQENWWMRAIVFVVAIGIVAVIRVLLKMFEKKIKENKEKKEKGELTQQVKETKALNKGVKGE